MTARSLICLHGYGVRGFFWNPVRDQLEREFPELLTPDLPMNSLEHLVENTKLIISSKSRLDRAPVSLIGHSLGGVLAALSARELGPRVVRKVIIIGSPFGERSELPGVLVRFLVRSGLMPDFLIRPKLFSAQTPPDKQKELLQRSVRESRKLRRELEQPVWFHTQMFDDPLEQPSLTVYSTRDRIVPALQTRAFGEALGSELVELGPNQRVGHNDFIWAPPVARMLLPRIIAFLKR
ncbi:MAG: alpha/beta fold hydrolase [Spirochaetia bacterium]